MIKFLSLSVSIIALLITSCDSNKKYLTDTPTSGIITIVADETYKPLLDSEIMVFENYYPKAKINVRYKPALEVIEAMDNDSIRLIVTATPVDTAYFVSFYKRKEYSPTKSIVAKDAIAVIANNDRKGLKIRKDELAKICNGEITNFSELENGGGNEIGRASCRERVYAPV